MLAAAASVANARIAARHRPARATAAPAGSCALQLSMRTPQLGRWFPRPPPPHTCIQTHMVQEDSEHAALWRELAELPPGAPLPARLPRAFYFSAASFLRGAQYAERLAEWARHLPPEKWVAWVAGRLGRAGPDSTPCHAMAAQPGLPGIACCMVRGVAETALASVVRACPLLGPWRPRRAPLHLLAHPSTCVPPCSLLVVDFGRFVREPEAVVREVLAFVGADGARCARRRPAVRARPRSAALRQPGLGQAAMYVGPVMAGTCVR